MHVRITKYLSQTTIKLLTFFSDKMIQSKMCLLILFVIITVGALGEYNSGFFILIYIVITDKD